MGNGSDVMNAMDAAAFLGVHVETLRTLARKNKIPSFKIGRDWRFRKETLMLWADEQRSGDNTCSGLVIGVPVMLLSKPVEPELLRRTMQTAMDDKVAMPRSGRMTAQAPTHAFKDGL
jgi:excisionase family DNA binding protein